MTDGILALDAGEAVESRERQQDFRRVIRELVRNKAALIGLVILLGVAASAIFAPLISPRDPLAQEITQRLKSPGWTDPAGRIYLLGTDHLGRDILSRLIFGARISLIIGLSAVAFAGTIGTLIGLVAGYRGGRVDDFCMRATDTMLAMPFILLALAVIAVLGPSLRNIILVLGITSWVSYARVVRAEVLTLRTREFVGAARALGGGGSRIVFRHLLPNVLTPVIVIATLEVARMIILESALSFLGLGVQPPTPTWGGMLADGRAYLSTAWWLATFPGLSENGLETVIFRSYPQLAELKRFFLDRGALCSLVSGSGSAVYGLFRDRAEAESTRAAVEQTVPAVLVETLSRERYWAGFHAGV